MKHYLLFVTTLVSIGTVLIGITGCSETVVSNKPLDLTQAKLLKVNMAYSQYTRAKGKPPKGPTDIKSFLAKMGDPDDLLKSDRDGQPFVVCWGVALQQANQFPMSWPVFAYEKQGLDGERFVLTTLSNVVKLTDDDFRQSIFPQGHKPSF